MKIKSVNIQHFGKFSDKELRFSDGINLIEGDNESGKSTLHAFIRGMLFGIDKNRGRAGKNDVYTRYLPWDAPGAYQGSVDIEHNGRNIRISRVFLQNARSCTAIDLDSAKSIDLDDRGITALIPGLTLSAFDNTVSCAQQQLKTKDDFGGYARSYIANMAGAREARVDVTSALERLDEKTGELTKKLKAIDENALKKELDDLLEDEKDRNYMLEDREKEVRALEETEQRKAEFDSLDNKKQARDRHEELVKLSGRIRELKKECAELEMYSTKVERLDDLSREAETTFRERQEASDRAAEECESLKEKCGIVEEAQGAYERENEKARKLLLTGISLSGLGAVAALASSNRLKIGILAGIILLIAGLVTMLFACISDREKKKYKPAFDEAHAIREELQKRELELKDVQALCREAAIELKHIEERRQEADTRADELRDVTGREAGEIRSLLIRLDEEDLSCIEGSCGIDPEKAEARIEALAGRYVRELEEYERKSREFELLIAEKKNELARIDGELAGYGDIGAAIDDAERKLIRVREDKAALEKELAAVRLAGRNIRGIADELKGSFDRHINELLSKACEQVTAGKYTDARLNSDYEPLVSAGTGIVQASSLSAGTAEQIALAFRLAMTRLMFEDTEVPMLFDEPFAYYDDARLRSALEAVSKINDRQIFIFTCNERERNVLDSIGTKYDLIRI